MRRRHLLKFAALAPLLLGVLGFGGAHAQAAARTRLRTRARPGRPGWPSASEWDRLHEQVGGRLIQPKSPFEICNLSPAEDACAEVLRQIKNPYFIGDTPALTQA